ncbi:hypothetical protein O3P69_012216 [Scylla paramamosain]|uniref:Synaptotagmin SMP domain-containing protein n=1 Tax=Scylla paramamosain TaxID=85552 RepID=A0AAW0TEJ9_SCYPA
MDMNFVYAGDCRIEINMNRKHLILDCLQIEGKVQVVMKPLMGRIPLIGGLQVFFLREPDVRFTLHPWEPVYKRNLCRQVKKMIADQMVAPNCWPIQLVEEITIEELKDISPAAQLMQQQSDGGGGRQRVIGLVTRSTVGWPPLAPRSQLAAREWPLFLWLHSSSPSITLFPSFNTAVTAANAAATVCLHLCTAKHLHRDRSATYTAATGDPSEAPLALRLAKANN